MNIHITILGDPVPYKRERINMSAVSRWMKVKMRGNPYRFGPLTYLPSECRKWQNAVKRLMPEQPKLKGKIGVWVVWHRTKKWTDSIHSLRPDGDNILKHLLDALQDCVIEDDAYVMEQHLIQKFDAKVPLLKVRVKLQGTKEKPRRWTIAPNASDGLIKRIARLKEK